ncbi:MAG: LON peptidase substrate-binding domain-containing protein [Terracidiphilus sp.]|jgi:ATP-dependent Lon protease
MTASRDKSEPRKLPMMPIRDMVIFPYMMTPFVAGRASSVRAIEDALNGDRKIFLATQHDASVDAPTTEQIYKVGSICNIVQTVKMTDGDHKGAYKVLVQGLERAESIDIVLHNGFYMATVLPVVPLPNSNPALNDLMTRVTDLFQHYGKLHQIPNPEMIIANVRKDNPAMLSDTIAAYLQLSVEKKQEVLFIFDPMERLEKIADLMTSNLSTSMVSR